jgi:tRNA-uridine 2-sulfurtransferase
VPPPEPRIVVAMSGGVDSSVAAARLVDRGFEVVGVTLHLWDTPDDGSVRGRCCAPEDQHDARRAAQYIGIAHYGFDRRALFAERIVEPFVAAYLAGQTPSPCVQCNREVKLAALFQIADRLGADMVATGHYARTERHGERLALLRGRDRAKDQSYFLYALRGRELARLSLPLGDSTKAEVRAEAVSRRLPGATKGESQELCFVPEGRYDGFVEARAADRLRPGNVVDASGQVVSRHAGIHRFTIGQRKGLGVALGAPAFVVGIDPERAEVRLGSAEALDAGGVWVDDVVLAEGVQLPVRAKVQVRSRAEPVDATVTSNGGQVAMEFHGPVRAVACGQMAVAYAGDRVLGGGRITRVVGLAGGAQPEHHRG